MNKTVPLFEKRLPHLSMHDWTRDIQALQAEARQRRQQGYQLRKRAAQLRHEADVTARWDYRLNSDACRDRYNLRDVDTLRRLLGSKLRKWAAQLRHEADVTVRWDYRLNSDACRDRYDLRDVDILRQLLGSELRGRAAQLRHEADVTVRWDYRLNSDACRDRIFEVSTWREKQRRCLESVRNELQALQQEKNNTEAALEALQVPFMVTSQCLSTRDTRLRTELTHDHLDVELKKELSMLEHNKRLLMDACQAAWEKGNELTNVGSRLRLEISNKDETLTLEEHAKDLHLDSAPISYRLDPTVIPAESMTERGYEECVQNTIDIAERLVRESKCCRESMFRAREQAANQAHEQSQTAEHTLRRRVYDTQRARNELRWQTDKLEGSMRQTSEEISRLEAALAAQEAPGKVVESRLATRARRPVLELVHDRLTDGLVEELQRVRLSEDTLRQKLEDALSEYRGMRSLWERLRADVEGKEHALETDRRLIDIREPLHRSRSAATSSRTHYDELAPLV